MGRDAGTLPFLQLLCESTHILRSSFEACKTQNLPCNSQMHPPSQSDCCLRQMPSEPRGYVYQVRTRIAGWPSWDIKQHLNIDFLSAGSGRTEGIIPHSCLSPNHGFKDVYLTGCATEGRACVILDTEQTASWCYCHQRWRQVRRRGFQNRGSGKTASTGRWQKTNREVQTICFPSGPLLFTEV